MAKAKFDDEQLLKIREIEEIVALESKYKVKAINAWRFLILWLSSFKDDLLPGKGDANFYLTKQQSAEFAYSYNSDLYPDIFVLLAQGQIYDCLKDIGIHCIKIVDDGVIIKISDFDMDGLYIAGLSIKIQAPESLEQRFKSLKKYCNYAQLAELASTYNPNSNKLIWNIKQVHNQTYNIEH